MPKVEFDKLKDHYNKVREAANKQKDVIGKLQVTARTFRDRCVKLEAEQQAV